MKYTILIYCFYNIILFSEILSYPVDPNISTNTSSIISNKIAVVPINNPTTTQINTLKNVTPINIDKVIKESVALYKSDIRSLEKKLDSQETPATTSKQIIEKSTKNETQSKNVTLSNTTTVNKDDKLNNDQITTTVNLIPSTLKAETNPKPANIPADTIQPENSNNKEETSEKLDPNLQNKLKDSKDFIPLTYQSEILNLNTDGLDETVTFLNEATTETPKLLELKITEETGKEVKANSDSIQTTTKLNGTKTPSLDSKDPNLDAKGPNLAETKNQDGTNEPVLPKTKGSDPEDTEGPGVEETKGSKDEPKFLKEETKIQKDVTKTPADSISKVVKDAVTKSPANSDLKVDKLTSKIPIELDLIPPNEMKDTDDVLKNPEDTFAPINSDDDFLEPTVNLALKKEEVINEEEGRDGIEGSFSEGDEYAAENKLEANPVNGDVNQNPKLPENAGKDRSYPQSHPVFPDQEDSHFFAYFVTGVIVFILGYLVVHNKQKILAIIVEGRTGRRRRSHTYKKLATDKNSQIF